VVEIREKKGPRRGTESKKVNVRVPKKETVQRRTEQ